MQYRTDPASGNRLSALGLGCMRFPGYQLGRPDAKAAQDIISRAVEQGINYLDTAYLYPGQLRLAWEWCSKSLACATRSLSQPSFPMPRASALRILIGSLTSSSKRLRTDHIDYYLMHNITSPAQWERVAALGIKDWIARQKREGRIRQIGSSYHGSADDFPRMLDAYDWDFVQVQYNYANVTLPGGDCRRDGGSCSRPCRVRDGTAPGRAFGR